MLSGIENTHRSNHSIFLPQNYGSPFNDTAEHISGLGLARLDLDRCSVAGEVIYTVEGDSTPISQQDEESRIATLAYALKRPGNSEDAAERWARRKPPSSQSNQHRTYAHSADAPACGLLSFAPS
jgi:hypothetical protein